MSVASQIDVSAQVEIIVVDDGSPVPAEDELKAVALPANIRVNLFKQRNSGCYPACNAAMDKVSADSDYIAFLDSDDEWFPMHLRNAICALELGYDWYFSDFYQLNQTVSAFQRAGRIDISAHAKIHSELPLRAYSGSFFNQIITGNILGTSTIVFKWFPFTDIRYAVDYRHTGAEYILWLHMALRSNRVAFSSEPECRYGGGVNIFSESAWGTEKYLTVRQDEIKYRKYVLKHMPVDAKQVHHLKGKIRESRINFCLGVLHSLRRTHRLNSKIIAEQLRLDPLTFSALLLVPAQLVLGRIRS